METESVERLEYATPSTDESHESGSSVEFLSTNKTTFNHNEHNVSP